MASKRNPSIIPRFTGRDGKKNLLAAICSQTSVAGEMALAQKILKVGGLFEYRTGETVIRQGDSDNDLYLIVSGSVGVVLNNREIATRRGGTHVGEMALLDNTSLRSASIVAQETSLLFKICEPSVTRVANAHPNFWRRLALELATRLRERSKFIHEPNSASLVFIGSSSEGLEEATSLHRSLTRKGITCNLWTQEVFQLSKTAIEDLVRMSENCDFAIIIMTADDMTSSRGKKNASPRDNVVFELGLFMGAIGRERTYIVLPKGSNLKLPTDLLGVTHAPYETGSASTAGRRMSGVTRAIAKQIQGMGPK